MQANTSFRVAAANRSLKWAAIIKANGGGDHHLDERIKEWQKIVKNKK